MPLNGLVIFQTTHNMRLSTTLQNMKQIWNRTTPPTPPAYGPVWILLSYIVTSAIRPNHADYQLVGLLFVAHVFRWFLPQLWTDSREISTASLVSY